MIDRDWPIQLIMSGIPSLEKFLKIDGQVRRRFKYANFAKISVDDHAVLIDHTIRQYAAKVNLKIAFNDEDMIVGRLAHGAFYELGLIFEILVDAIECALDAGKTSLSLDDFADAYADRTLEPTELNVFVAREWDRTDTEQLQIKLEDRQAEELSKRKPSRRA